MQTWIGGVGLLGLLTTLVLGARANKAATEALNAQITAERPWMSFKSVTMVDLGRTELDDGMIRLPYAYGEVVNTGRTPAVIRRLSSRLIYIQSVSDLPDLPDYGEVTEVDGGFVVVPDAVFKDFVFLDCITIGEGEIDLIRWEKAALVLYGFIEYEDPFGKTHTFRYCRKWHEPKNPQDRRAQAAFRIDGPASYNEHK